MKRIVRNVLPHAVIILAGIFMVFLVLDKYNPTMDFVNNEISLKLFWGFCILAVVNSAVMISLNRKDGNKKEDEAMQY